jgi:RNA polymerase sigma-70 factor (ECF subfamily)
MMARADAHAADLGSTTLMAQSDAHQAVITILPRLRAFAISLTGNVDRADDLVQEAVTRGLANLDKFEPGTSMQAWLFTILRNQFHTFYRKRRSEIEDPDGLMAGMLAAPPEQDGHLDLRDLQAALAKLPAHHREVLLLIGAEGMSYEETAQIVGTNVGTVKSRMNRARACLAKLLHIESEDDLGSDRVVRAALATTSAHHAGARRAA